MQLTLAAVQAVQNDATARGLWLTWIVFIHAAHPGQVVARAHTADHRGGSYLPGALLGDTLDDLRRKLPLGLVRHDRAPTDPHDVLEVWN